MFSCHQAPARVHPQAPGPAALAAAAAQGQEPQPVQAAPVAVAAEVAGEEGASLGAPVVGVGAWKMFCFFEICIMLYHNHTISFKI